MDRDSLKKLMLHEAEELVRDLRDSVKTKSLLEVNYFEGKLNECISLYQSFFREPIPVPLWERVKEAWGLVTKREKKEKANEKQ